MTFKVSVTYKVPISYIFTWHALSDACPKCRYLNGREFHDQDLFQNVLWDHIYGDVWDLNADHTLTHPNCRCQVEVRVICDWTQDPEMQELANILQIPLTAEVEEVIDVGQIQEMRNAVSELKIALGEVKGEFREIEYLGYRTISLLGRMGLPPQIDQALSQLQRGVLTMRMAHSAAMMLATETTLGLATGAITGIGAGLVGFNLLQEAVAEKRPARVWFAAAHRDLQNYYDSQRGK